MNKYDCSFKICDLTQQLADGLRGEEDEIIHDMYTFRASLSRGSHSLAKKYNPTISYKIGDVVGLNGNVFISTANNNIARNPLTDRGVWAYFLNPFEKNQGKVKAMCMYHGSTILHSYNISSLTIHRQNDSTRGYTILFEFQFANRFAQIPSIFTAMPSYQEFFPQIDDMAFKPICAEITRNKALIIHNKGSINKTSAFPQFTSVLWNPEQIVGFFAVYENSEVIYT